MTKLSVTELSSFKAAKRPVSMLTCYDYPTATVCDGTIDILLVGDSVGTNVLGYNSEKDVTVTDICHHTRAVKRGVSQSIILSDLPYNSYTTVDQAIDTAKALQEAGADAVKLEGFFPDITKAILEAGIPVIGHLGLLPQTQEQKRIQAKTADAALQCINDAKALEALGISALVIELIPNAVAKILSSQLNIPTIGIACGQDCDGQVQVIHDILGLNPRLFKHVKRYDNSLAHLRSIVQQYSDDIQSGNLLKTEQNTPMADDELVALKQELGI